ncbi:unnamed protein product [Plasmodium vivax]|uniref:(malaria parasite P. vivax) hypothetical protein n=1 Tax=Plasmodium vivax TaxID=5855 RepID=A0A8S4H4L4_PLAVI|nr:unnamed protein product [Plasmodium vivax]
MDTKKLQEEYPFLDNILHAYENYDKPVETGDELFSFYNNELTYHGGNKNDYTDISVKLLRNLKTLSGNTYNDSQKPEYCIYLYHWLYYKKKESDIGDLLLSIIFNEFEKKYLIGKINMCPYNVYRNISVESDEIIKLDIFYNNIQSIRDILIKGDQSNNCKLQGFIYNCVNIYKNMNKKYCLKDYEGDITKKDICDIVKKFHSGYTSYILEKESDIKISIPSSSYINNERNTTYTVGCSSNGNQEESHSNNNDQPDSTVLHNVPKILGTLAGVSSFIAMSYKFTPFRKFFQLRKGTASLSNSLNEKEPINLINNESDSLNGSSKNTKYNIGYGSV